MHAAVQDDAPPAGRPVEQNQYLTFMLGGEMFAIGILWIKEIIEFGGLTEVPMTPACVRGVINLRGAVVPVLDLAARFGRDRSAVTRRSCIIVVELDGEGDRQDVGVMVDAVNAVLDIPAADIEPAPEFGASIRTDFIEGMGKVDGRFVILLQPGRVLSTAEIGALAGAGNGAARQEGNAHVDA